LQYIQGLRDGTLEAIERDLAMVVPGARRIRVLPARIHEEQRDVTGSRFELEWDGLGWIAADQLSHGTLLALGLVTALRWNPARMVLLDDIDQGLHPAAQRKLVTTLRQILEQQPHVQVVATSHSPFVLDVLQAEEVFVAGAESTTSTRIRRLDQHPAWAKRSQYMHPGEFWSAVGEDWVAENG
jgi:predicted ATPase